VTTTKRTAVGSVVVAVLGVAIAVAAYVVGRVSDSDAHPAPTDQHRVADYRTGDASDPGDADSQCGLPVDHRADGRFCADGV